MASFDDNDLSRIPVCHLETSSLSSRRPESVYHNLSPHDIGPWSNIDSVDEYFQGEKDAFSASPNDFFPVPCGTHSSASLLVVASRWHSDVVSPERKSIARASTAPAAEPSKSIMK